MAEPVDDTTNPDNTSNPANQGQPVPPEPPAAEQGATPPAAGPQEAGAGTPPQPAAPEPAAGSPAAGEPAGELPPTPAEPLGQPGDAIMGEPPSQPAEPSVPAEPAVPGEPSVPSVPTEPTAEPVESVGGELATTSEDQGRQYDGTDPHHYAGAEDNYDHGQYGQGTPGAAEQWEYQDEKEPQEEQDEEEDDEDGGQKKMTLVEHLEELRTRIIRAAIGLAIGVGIAFAFNEYTFEMINAPLIQVLNKRPVILDMSKGFTMYMTISLYVGLIISSPWVFYQLWMFISAGLYPNERKYVTRSVPFSAALFIIGAVFFVKVIAVRLLIFLKYWNEVVMKIDMVITQDSHLDFMTDMMLIFGICFQMPLAVLILAKIGLINVKTLSRYRKHAIVGILVAATLLSPSPSPLDQMALAIPMYLLYEFGVLLAYFLVERPRRREEAAEAAEEAAERAAERAAAGTGPDDEPADAEYEEVDGPQDEKDRSS